MRRQNRELDRACTEHGRRPCDVRRSFVLWKPLYPWQRPEAFERNATALAQAGTTEFIVMWPPQDQFPLLEAAAARLPALRHP